MKSQINGISTETLAQAYELITIGATLSGVSEHLAINRDRLRKALWLAKTKGIRNG